MRLPFLVAARFRCGHVGVVILDSRDESIRMAMEAVQRWHLAGWCTDEEMYAIEWRIWEAAERQLAEAVN